MEIPKMKEIKKVVLAYSGGLDTSIIIPWLKENYNNCEVIAVSGNVGQASELEGLEEKAIATGASKIYIEDLTKEFLEDYVFPGLVLRTGGTSANFTLADNTKTTINLELTTGLSIRAVSGLKPTLDGTIHMGADVSSFACDGSELTIASTLIGNGNWEVRGAQKGKLPHYKIAFTSDNSEWKGSISLVRYKAPATTVADEDHLKIVVVNPAGLGGALDEFNCKALSLADCSEMIVTNSLELAKGLNRGLYVTNTATVNVDADCDFVCNWPITFDGPLRKVGGGTLCLGGDAKFLDSAGELAGVPRSDVDCRLSVTNGAVKALRHDCLNGVTVELLENGCLALDSNPDDAQVRRYGFYNVNTDTPFPADGEGACHFSGLSVHGKYIGFILSFRAGRCR